MEHSDSQATAGPQGATEAPSEVVHLYWRPGCAFCSSLRGRLRRAGLATVEHNIWSDSDAAAIVRAHAGGNETVPTVVIGDVAMVNPGAREVLARAVEAGIVATPKRRGLSRLRLGLGALLAVIALLAGACGSSGESSTAPTFTAETVSGGELASSSLDGKPAVLWFWAPWCSVCAREAPDVAAVAGANKGKVTFVGVAGRGKVPAMKKFVSEHQLDGFQHAVDADGGIWADFGVASQPAFAFVDRDGNVTTSLKALSRSELEAKVEALAAA